MKRKQTQCNRQQRHRAQGQRPVNADQTTDYAHVTPLNARSPILAIENNPMSRPRR